MHQSKHLEVASLKVETDILSETWAKVGIFRRLFIELHTSLILLSIFLLILASVCIANDRAERNRFETEVRIVSEILINADVTEVPALQRHAKSVKAKLQDITEHGLLPASFPIVIKAEYIVAFMTVLSGIVGTCVIGLIRPRSNLFRDLYMGLAAGFVVYLVLNGGGALLGLRVATDLDIHAVLLISFFIGAFYEKFFEAVAMRAVRLAGALIEK